MNYYLVAKIKTLAFIQFFQKVEKQMRQAQARRPDLSYGANYSKEINSSIYGSFNLNLNYKHTGQFIDWDGSKNSRQNSTDLVDLSIKKNYMGKYLFYKFN